MTLARTLAITVFALVLALSMSAVASHSTHTSDVTLKKPAEPWTQLESTPSGATIIIKGVKYGVTPRRLPWPDGKPPTITLKKGINFTAVVVLKEEDKGKTRRIKLKGKVDINPF